jgi:hypothetical protein
VLARAKTNYSGLNFFPISRITKSTFFRSTTKQHFFPESRTVLPVGIFANKKNPNFGIIWKALDLILLGIFQDLLVFLGPNVTLLRHLVYFWRFGKL